MLNPPSSPPINICISCGVMYADFCAGTELDSAALVGQTATTTTTKTASVRARAQNGDDIEDVTTTTRTTTRTNDDDDDNEDSDAPGDYGARRQRRRQRRRTTNVEVSQEKVRVESRRHVETGQRRQRRTTKRLRPSPPWHTLSHGERSCYEPTSTDHKALLL